ncbi:hypothetical protein ACTK50_002997 [Salmonella enterica subsp. enterica serovar Braenderup]
MTTITKEEVKAFIEQIESDLANGWEAQIFELKLARIALASLDAEPVAWTDEQELRDVEKDGLGYMFTVNPIVPGADPCRVIRLYAEPPAPVVDADPVVFTDERNLHHIARGRETSLIWGKQNQEVGDIPLYRHAQPVPVVPDEMATSDDMNLYQKSFAQGYNACRNAMLNGGKS